MASGSLATRPAPVWDCRAQPAHRAAGVWQGGGMVGSVKGGVTSEHGGWPSQGCVSSCPFSCCLCLQLA